MRSCSPRPISYPVVVSGAAICFSYLRSCFLFGTPFLACTYSITYLSSSKIGGAGTYLRLAASLPYLFIPRDCLGPPISPPSDSGTTPDALRGGWVSPFSHLDSGTNERTSGMRSRVSRCLQLATTLVLSHSPTFRFAFAKGGQPFDQTLPLSKEHEKEEGVLEEGYDKKKIKKRVPNIYQHASSIHPWVPTTIGLFGGLETRQATSIRGSFPPAHLHLSCQRAVGE